MRAIALLLVKDNSSKRIWETYFSGLSKYIGYWN